MGREKCFTCGLGTRLKLTWWDLLSIFAYCVSDQNWTMQRSGNKASDFRNSDPQSTLELVLSLELRLHYPPHTPLSSSAWNLAYSIEELLSIVQVKRKRSWRRDEMPPTPSVQSSRRSWKQVERRCSRFLSLAVATSKLVTLMIARRRQLDEMRCVSVAVVTWANDLWYRVGGRGILSLLRTSRMNQTWLYRPDGCYGDKYLGSQI